MSSSSQASQCYDIIEAKATSNTFIQGFSGILGIFTTLAADVAVIPTIYAPMWDEVRRVYGLGPVEEGSAKTVIMKIWPEILSDIAFDKVLGNVPVIGIYFNAICAKAMTWRLGTLFAFLAARGSEVPEASVKEAMALIRHMFPQKEMFSFTTPNKQNFLKLVESVNGNTVEEFNSKVSQALNLLRA